MQQDLLITDWALCPSACPSVTQSVVFDGGFHVSQLARSSWLDILSDQRARQMLQYLLQSCLFVHKYNAGAMNGADVYRQTTPYQHKQQQQHEPHSSHNTTSNSHGDDSSDVMLLAVATNKVHLPPPSLGHQPLTPTWPETVVKFFCFSFVCLFCCISC